MYECMQILILLISGLYLNVAIKYTKIIVISRSALDYKLFH